MRLTAEFWVGAYLRRLDLEGIHAHLLRRGDATAGTVVVKLATLDGRARAFQRSFDPVAQARIWIVLAEGEEAGVDAALARAAARDPDLWIVEIEDRAGRSLLDEPGLAGD